MQEVERNGVGEGQNRAWKRCCCLLKSEVPTATGMKAHQWDFGRGHRRKMGAGYGGSKGNIVWPHITSLRRPQLTGETPPPC